jgi:hypothetical protein
VNLLIDRQKLHASAYPLGNFERIVCDFARRVREPGVLGASKCISVLSHVARLAKPAIFRRVGGCIKTDTKSARARRGKSAF